MEDAEWALFEPFLVAVRGQGGRPAANHRQTLDGRGRECLQGIIDAALLRSGPGTPQNRIAACRCEVPSDRERRAAA